ncbi:MAG: hypothetical protein ACKOPG_03620 [Novosphingobium sp.]
MSIGLIIAGSLLAMLLFALAGVVLLGRFLTHESEADDAMGFDPFTRPKPPYSERFLRWFSRWKGGGPRRLTNRRDRDGRFRKHDR